MDELWDEGAVGGEGSAEAGIGATLLMADLEAAIAAAGDEIAALGRVTEAAPRPGLPPQPTVGGGVASGPAVSELKPPSPAATVQPPLRAEAGTTRARAVGSVAGSAPAVAAPIAPALAVSGQVPPAGAAEVGWESAAPTKPAGADGGEFQHPAPPEFLAPSAVISPVQATQPASVPMRAARMPAQREDASPTTVAEAAGSWPVGAQTWPVAPGTTTEQSLSGLEEDGRGALSPLDRLPASSMAPVGRGGLRQDAAADGAGAATSVKAGGGGSGAEAAADDGAARGGPTEGDVFLDGERVGRWMARHLARELGGPQGATTGFDTRMGPAWPGSLHGN